MLSHEGGADLVCIDDILLGEILTNVGAVPCTRSGYCIDCCKLRNHPVSLVYDTKIRSTCLYFTNIFDDTST